MTGLALSHAIPKTSLSSSSDFWNFKNGSVLSADPFPNERSARLKGRVIDFTRPPKSVLSSVGVS